MNCCHGNNNENKSNGSHGHKHGGMSHMLMMALCCGAPVIILLLVPLLAKAGGTGTATLLAGIAPFICPIMMLFMIPMMLKNMKGGTDKKDCHQQEQLRLEEKPRDK